jgi:hypothetical protein
VFQFVQSLTATAPFRAVMTVRPTLARTDSRSGPVPLLVGASPAEFSAPFRIINGTSSDNPEDAAKASEHFPLAAPCVSNLCTVRGMYRHSTTAVCH